MEYRQPDRQAESRAQQGLGPADPVLMLKATPPRVSKALHARPRLSLLGSGLADKAVVVVHAASGSGKTSLFAQWRREALQSGAVVAWLSLDERDNDARFIQGLSVAMKIASGRKNFGQPYGYSANIEADNLEMLTRWLADVSDLAVDALLILDDAHTLPAETVGTTLAYLLNNAPANLRIVIGTRKRLALKVADMLAHGWFAELDNEALRFNLDETMAVLRARLGTRIDADTCVRLHELTEGWPLGLQLAISTIERHADLNEAIARFSVRSGDLQRYFVECLVDGLPPEQIDFLTQISITPSLHPDLCREITGQADSAELLARLQDSTPIILKGVDSEWLRMHPLARDFLQDRFNRIPAERRQAIHRQASVWLTQRGMFEAAARQSLRAGDERTAYGLIARCLYDVLKTGQVSRVSEWIDRLPAAEIESNVRLQLAVAWTLTTSDRPADAAGPTKAIIDNPAIDPADRCEAALIYASAALFDDDLVSIEKVLLPWLDSLGQRPPILRTVGANLSALQDIYHGLPERARYLLQPLSSALGPAVGAYTRACSDWVLAFSHLWQGQLAPAGEILRASLSRTEEECGRRGPIAVMLAATLAAVLWEQDLTAEIPQLLADRLDVLERKTAPEALMMGHVCAARLAALTGSEQRAFNLLENLDALGEARGLPRLSIASLYERIRLHALRHHGDACAQLQRRLSGIATAATFERLGPLAPLAAIEAGLARAYGAIATQDWTRALQELDPLVPVTTQLKRTRDAIQVNLLRALALKRIGEDGLPVLVEAQSMAATLGLQRIVADTHPGLVDWLRQRESEAELRPTQGGGRAVLAPASAPAQALRPAAQREVAPSAILTPKERDVLQLLVANLSNKQIALALDVSGETIKWHLKNLFGKFNAVSRKHLLDRAQMLGILDATPPAPDRATTR